MATDAPPPSKEQHKLPSPEEFAEVHESAEFGELRRSYRSFAFPLTVGFIAWYLLYVLLSNYAVDFMSTKVVGNIHLGLIIGLLQFVSTFAITWAYVRWADRKFDPAAEELGRRVHLPEVER